MRLSPARVFAVLCLLSPLALFATDHATAATKPPQPPSKPKHKTNGAPPSPVACPAPTAAQCRDLNYIVGACGQRKDSQDSCARTLSNARKPQPSGHGFYKTTAKNYDINTTEWANDKFTPYVPGQSAAQTGRGTGFLAKRERERFALSKQYTPAMNAEVVKNIATAQFETDGNEVHSCDEYIYKYYYDWVRFEDAAAACGKDMACVADVALGNRPGPKIAGKAGVGNGLRQKSPSGAGTLHGPLPWYDRDFSSTFYEKVPTTPNFIGWQTVEQQSSQFTLLSGDLPKNAWFSFASQWLDVKWLATIFGQKWAADFTALSAALGDGSIYYNLSNQATQGNNEKYADEWAWHKAMRQKTKNVPDEQAKQIAHRTALIEALLLTAGTPGSNPYYAYQSVVPESITKYTWGVDPFERLGQGVNEGLFQQRSTERRRSRRHGRAAPPPSPPTPPPQSKTVAPSSSPFKAPPAGWTADPASPNMPQFLCTPATTPVLVLPGATYDEGVQAGMSRCQLMNMYLAEWWRKKRNEANGGCKDNGNCGCLHIDPANNSAACDWSPRAFNDRWVAPGFYQKQRQAALAYCQNFGNASPTIPGPAGDLTAADTKNLDGYEDYMRRGEKAMGDLRKIPNRPNAKKTNAAELKKADWGQLKQDGSEFGDRSFFAGAYDARAGWELRPVALIPSVPKLLDDKGFEMTGQVCQMTGELYGVFQANAWIFGGEINAVDGDVWLVLNDSRGLAENSTGAGGPVPAPKNLGDRQAHYEAHLLVLGYQLFATTKSGTGDVFGRYEAGTASQNEYNTVDATKPVTLGSSHDSWNLPDPQPEIPFSIGPIPCYISGYAELSLDVEATAQVDLPSDCSKPVGYPGHKFGPRLQVTPSASLAGVAEAGVGIAGLISVGIRGELTIVDLELPITTSLSVDAPKDKDPAKLNFGIGVDGFLTTLGGAISVYFELLFFDEEIELFSWGGIGPSKFQIVPPFHTKVDLPAVRTFVTSPAPQGTVRQ